MTTTARTILLVEDEALIALREQRDLENAGYHVVHALTGERAVDIVESGPAAIDLILMDIDLGKGMDGTDAARRILAAHDIPIIFLSSHREPDIVGRTEEITSYGYVVKSSVFTVLDASIKMAFRLFAAHRQIDLSSMELERSNEELGRSLAALRKTNARLAQSEDKFSKLFYANPDYVTISGVESGLLLDVNDGFCQLTGYSREEALGRSVLPGGLDIWADPEERKLFAEILAREGRIANRELRLRRKDGSIFTVNSFGRILELDGEKCVIAVGSDITQRKDMENELRRSERRGRTIIDASPDGIVEMAADGRIVFASQRCAVKLGHAGVEELVGRNMADIVAPAELPAARAYVGAVLRGEAGRSVGFTLLGKDGTPVPVEVNAEPLAAEDGDETHVIIALRDITVRKRTETALAESENKYRLVFDGAADALVITDLDDRFLEVNRKIVERLGYTREKLLAMTVAEIDGSQDEEQRRRRIGAVRQGGTLTFRTSQRRKDGSLVPVEISCFVTTWEGKPAVISFSRDITELIKAEAASVTNQAILESTIDRQNDLYVVSVDRDFNCLYRNRAYHDVKARALGLDIGIGDNLLANLPRDSLLEQALPSYRKALQGESTRAIEEYPDVPLAIDAIYNPMYSSDGGIIGATSYALDISERRKQEAETKEARDKYLKLIDAMGEGFCYSDERDVFLMANPSCGRVFGVEPRALVGRSIQDFLDDRGRRIIAEEDGRRARGETTEYDLPIIRPDGGERWIRVIASPLATESGAYAGASALFRDVTGEREANEALRRLVRTKETLMKELEHRVKNSFALVSSLLDIARGEITDEQAIGVLLDTGTRIKSLSSIYEQLYLAESVEAIDFGRYLESLVATIVGTFTRGPGRIAFSVEAEHVQVDTRRAISLGLIVNELLTNALKYAFPDGRAGRIAVRLSSRDGMIRLSVSDDGVGLPGADIADTSPSMGMTLIRLLAEQIEGSLEVDLSAGTTIAVAFSPSPPALQ
jgi:PAS domain S-box-containing protein